MMYFFNSHHCDFCGKEVVSHLAITTGGRPCYACDECSKKAENGEKISLKEDS